MSGAITGMPEVDDMTPSQAFHAGRKIAAAENERLRAALKAMYDRYASDEDGWEIEPECHLLARCALGLDEQKASNT